MPKSNLLKRVALDAEMQTSKELGWVTNHSHFIKANAVRLGRHIVKFLEFEAIFVCPFFFVANMTQNAFYSLRTCGAFFPKNKIVGGGGY